MNRTETGRKLPDRMFGEIIRMGMESGEIDRNLPIEYVLYAIFCKVMTYMMCIATRESFGIDNRKMRELVIAGLLKELKNEI